MEERQRRAADSLFDRGQAPPRLRNLKAHRATFGRRGALLCGLALPFALSPRKARLDSGPLGGKGRAAPPTLLWAHAAGAESPGLAATRLAGICPSNQPHHGGRKC